MGGRRRLRSDDFLAGCLSYSLYRPRRNRTGGMENDDDDVDMGGGGWSYYQCLVLFPAIL